MLLEGGAANLGYAPHDGSSKNRTGKIACTTKSRFLGALGMTSACSDLSRALELERLERFFLRGDQQFAVKGAFGGATIESFFRGKARKVGIIVFLR